MKLETIMKYLILGMMIFCGQALFGMKALEKKQQEIARQQFQHAHQKQPGSLAQFFKENQSLVRRYAQAILDRQQAAYLGNIPEYRTASGKVQREWGELAAVATAAGIAELKKTDSSFMASYNEQKRSLYDADIMQRFGPQLDVATVTPESFRSCEQSIQRLLTARAKNKTSITSQLGPEGAKLFFDDVEKFAQNLREALHRKAVAHGIDLTAPQAETAKEEHEGGESKKTKSFDKTPTEILALDKKGLITLFGLPDSFNVIYVADKDKLSDAIAVAINKKQELQNAIDERQQELKAMYKLLSIKLHPDKNPGDEENARSAFGKIDKFYKDLIKEATEVYEKAEKFQNLVETDY